MSFNPGNYKAENSLRDSKNNPPRKLEESSAFPSSGFLKPTNPSTPPFRKLPTILETFAPTDFSFDAPSRIGENRSNFEQIPINFGASTSFGSASTSSNFPRNEGFGNQLNPKTPIDFVPPPNYNTNYQFPGASTLNDNAASTSMPGNSKYNQDNNPMNLKTDCLLNLSVQNISIYGDVRDLILQKFNHIQAMYGCGKAFYCMEQAPVLITPENAYCRFKTIVYNKIPAAKDEMGMVGLVIQKSCQEANTEFEQEQLISTLRYALGSDPGLIVNVKKISALSENKCQVDIFIEIANDFRRIYKRRISATEVSQYLLENIDKLHILRVECIFPILTPNLIQLDEYLRVPPSGFNPHLWEQAKIDNPDPQCFIPVPILHFAELKWRRKCQLKQIQIQMNALQGIKDHYEIVKQKASRMNALHVAQKRKYDELSNKILHIIVCQQLAILKYQTKSESEEEMQVNLCKIYSSVSSPINLKRRIKDISEKLKTHNIQPVAYKTVLTAVEAEDFITLLTMLQSGMERLFVTVKDDIAFLK